MYVLQQAVFDLLRGLDGFEPILYYFAAPVDSRLPYIEYWTGDGAKDTWAGFGIDGREYSIYVQVSGRDGKDVQQFYDAAHEALEYVKLDVPGWITQGKIVWDHELDDPGDNTQDDDIIYYAGGCFKIKLHRQRTDV